MAAQVAVASQPNSRLQQLQTPQGAATALGIAAVAALSIRAIFGSGSRSPVFLFLPGIFLVPATGVILQRLVVLLCQ